MLKRIVLRDFKGLSIDASLGKSEEFAGKNGTGKTTLIDGILWGITGKDSRGRTDYDIKTRVGDEVQHHLEHVVELHFDGFSVSRCYKEKWKKRTGEFNGHETIFKIDTGIGFVDVLKKDYESFCQKKFGDNPLLFSDPFYFADSLHWEKRRKIVNSAIDSVDEKKIAESVGVDADVFGDDASETRKRLEKMSHAIEEAIAEKNIRIDEKSLEIVRTKSELEKQSEEKTSLIDAEKKAIESMADIDHEKYQNLIQKEKDAISAIDNGLKPPELQQLRDKRSDAISDKERKSRSEIENARIRSSKNESVREDAERHNRVRADRIQSCEKLRESLRAEYNDEKAKQWTGDTVCPTCSQSLPDERIEEIKASFNSKKAEAMKAINAKAKANKAELEKILETPEVEIMKNDVEIPEMYDSSKDEDVKKLDLQIDKINKKIATQEKNTEKAKQPHLEKIKELLAEKQSAKDKLAEKKQPHTKRIDELTAELDSLRLTIAKSDDAQKRIAELQAEITAESDKNSKLKKTMNDIDKFIEAKIYAMEEDIFKKFGVKFKMFYRTIEGEFKEMCEVLIEGDNSTDPFPSANRGHQMKTGVQLCSCLQDIFDIDMPILADNFESVTEKIDSKKQLILTTVSEKYEKITQLEA